MKTREIEEEACKWESGELGSNEATAVAVPAAEELAVDDALELQLISIRLQKGLIESLKFLAGREGLGYQPLIRRLLMRYVEGEMKSIAMDELVLARKAGKKVVAKPAAEETPAAKRKRA